MSSEINVREDILKLIPWKKEVKVFEIIELLKEHHQFKPESKLSDLPYQVKKSLIELSEEGILERPGNGSVFYLEHQYLAGR